MTKSNALIEAGYRLSLTEMQIILYGISLVNPLAKSFPLQYKICVKNFAEMFHRKHGNIYSEIKEVILSRFWERDFSYQDDNGVFVTNRWLTQVKRQDNMGYIEIKFSEELRPYLYQLKKHFTTYYIDQVSGFKSVYAIRFYEMSIMHLRRKKQEKCSFRLTVDEIRHRLKLQEKYVRFYDLKQRVLETAKREINKYSDVKLDYKVVNLGRLAYEIEFDVLKKGDCFSGNTVNRGNDFFTKNPTSLDKLTPSSLEKAKKILITSRSKWDFYVIEQQFYEYIEKIGKPKNLEGAFLGFIRRKIKTSP